MKNKISLIAVVLAFMIAATVTVFAAYDSSSDPLVSLSYLNNVFKPGIDNEIASLRSTIGTLESTIGDLESDIDSLNTQLAGTQYTVICVKKGYKVISDNNPSVSTELILRSGTATAVSQYSHGDENPQGLSDLTSMDELLNGDELAKNHYIIIPRGDGRGVLVTSAEAYFLIRGPYSVVKG